MHYACFFRCVFIEKILSETWTACRAIAGLSGCHALICPVVTFVQEGRQRPFLPTSSPSRSSTCLSPGQATFTGSKEREVRRALVHVCEKIFFSLIVRFQSQTYLDSHIRRIPPDPNAPIAPLPLHLHPPPARSGVCMPTACLHIKGPLLYSLLGSHVLFWVTTGTSTHPPF